MRTSLLSCLLVIAGCRTPALKLEIAESAPELVAFHPPEGMLTGFDAPGETAIRDGDQILLGVRLTDTKLEKTWFIHLTMLADMAMREGRALNYVGTWTITDSGGRRTVRYPSWLVPARLKLLDAEGKELGSSVILLPARFLQRGFFAASRMGRALPATKWRPETRTQYEQVLIGASTLLTLMQMIQDEKLLADILWQVVAYPSLLGIVMNLGVRVAVTPSFEVSKPTKVTIGDQVHEGERFPFAITANAEPAFLAELTAIAPSSPMTATGGMWRIIGHQAGRKTRQLEIRVLAARRGQHRGNVITVRPNGTFARQRGTTTLEVER